MHRDNCRRYHLELGLAAAVYVAAVMLSTWLARSHVPEDSVWRYGLALIPLLPALAMLAAVLRYIRRLDELQQRIQLEAAVIAIVIACVFCVAAGLLQAYAGLPDINLIWVMSVIVIAWGLGGLIARRKYT